MKSLTVGEFKSKFSEVVDRVRKGESIAVEYGKRREIIGIFSPPDKTKSPKSILGLLQGKIDFDPKHFKITDEEFLGIK